MCVWALMISQQKEDQRDLPHIPQIDTPDGFLDILALGKLLIFMQSIIRGRFHQTKARCCCLCWPYDLAWLQFHSRRCRWHIPTIFCSRVAFCWSTRHFGYALLVYQKSVLTHMSFYRTVSKRYSLRVPYFESAIPHVYKEVFQDDLDIDSTDQPDELGLIWDPQFSVNFEGLLRWVAFAWKGFLLMWLQS